MSYDFVQAWRNYQPKSRPLTDAELAAAIKHSPTVQAWAKYKVDEVSADRYGLLRHGTRDAAWIADRVDQEADRLAYKIAPILRECTALLVLETVNLLD